MGMTIRVNFLKDGNVTGDEADRRAMYNHIDKLDRLSTKLSVRKLPAFLDATDLEAGLRMHLRKMVHGK